LEGVGGRVVGRRSDTMNAGSETNPGVRFRGLSRPGRVLLEINFILGVLHLVDHVLRADHKRGVSW
jgi:hypothetical protein